MKLLGRHNLTKQSIAIVVATKAQESDDHDTQLQSACRSGAARELYEETEIDVRNNLTACSLPISESRETTLTG